MAIAARNARDWHSGVHRFVISGQDLRINAAEKVPPAAAVAATRSASDSILRCRRGETVTPDKINGELTLGFWVSLFNADYELALWKDLRRAFPNLPKVQRQRKNVSAPLNTIRSLRNRVFHNEAISWNITRLTDLHSIIIKVTSWMNVDIPEWLEKIDRYDKVSLKVKKEWYGWWKFIFKF